MTFYGEEVAKTYDIDIEDSALAKSGFIRFSLSRNGKSEEDGKSKMTLYNIDAHRIIYCDIYKHDYARTIQTFRDTLTASMKEDELLDDSTVANLIVCFDNACKILKEDKDSGFFHRSVNGKTAKKSSQQQQNEQFDYSSLPVISVSKAARLHHGHVKVQGIISAMGKLRKLTTRAIFVCADCGALNEGRCKKFSDGRPVLYTDVKRPLKCINCSEHDLYDTSEYEFVNSIIMELIDADTFSDIDSLHTTIFDNDTENAHTHVGERVTITGDIHVIEQSKYKSVSYLYAKTVKYEGRDEVIVTQKDIEAIKRFTTEKERFPKLKGKSVLENLSNMFATEIIGYQHAKMGILLSAASAGLDLNEKKIHIVHIGDPGQAKTALLNRSIELVPNSRYESAENSTGLSLTAMVTKEEDSTTVLRPGPVPMARGAICAINEVGRLHFEDQKHLLSTMQEQFIIVNKYEIHCKILSPTVIHLSSNPISGAWKDPEHINLDEFPALKPLIDRIDLIFTYRTTREKEKIRLYADKKFDSDDKPICEYYGYLLKHVEYSKRFKPKLSDDAKYMLKEYYIKIAQRYGSPRVRETIVILAKMIARLKLKNTVDVEDAKETMQFYNRVLEDLEQVVNIVSDPRDVLFDECLKIYEELATQFGLAYVPDVVRLACERNEQVKLYVGNNNNNSLSLTNNHKLREVCEMLQNDRRVMQTDKRPIAFKWVGNKENNSSKIDNNTVTNINDHYDDYDMDKSEEKNKNANFSQGSIPNEYNNIVEPCRKNEKNNFSAKDTMSLTSLASLIADKKDIEQNTKNEEPTLLLFKCFYCDECFDGKDGNECNIKRIEHMDIEHPGKPHYPTTEAFENRLGR